MNPLPPTDYSQEDIDRRIKASPHVVVIQTASNVTVPVEIEIHGGEPAFEPQVWDHIAEASLHVPTGELQVHECTGSPVADFQIAKGWYRVRSFHRGLGSIYDAKPERDDHYTVVLWPAASAEVRVIKQYSSSK
jgi:hypothetical protein